MSAQFSHLEGWQTNPIIIIFTHINLREDFINERYC